MTALAGDHQPASGRDLARALQAASWDDAIEAVRGHPDLPRAVAAAAGGMIGLYRRNTILNRIINDRGRLIGATLALYLHVSPTPDGKLLGLTVGRFQATCVHLDICSPGRAQAFLAMMRLSGYLVAEPDRPDRRQRRLLPTDRLIELHRQRWRQQFMAMAPILPQAGKALDAIERPEFVAAFLRHLGVAYFAGFRVLHYAPELEGIVESNAGLLVVFSLITAVTGPVPPDGVAVPVSKSGLSARFGIARAHTRGLLTRLADAGLIGRSHAAEVVIVLPRLAQTVSGFFAAAFVLLAHCADAAMQDCAATPQDGMPRTGRRSVA